MMNTNEINTYNNINDDHIINNLPCGGLTGAGLKWIALITMLIDHLAAACGMYMTSAIVLMSFSWGLEVYYLMRLIGRISFPLFAFCFVEGFIHTKNRSRQLLTLIIFGVISQIPYYFCLCNSSFWDFNILLTLAFCYLTLMFFEWGIFRLGISLQQVRHPLASSIFVLFQYSVFAILTAVIFGWISWLINLDYDWGAVAMVLAFYIFRKNRVLAATTGVGALLIFMILIGSGDYVPTLFVAWICIMLYNGQRGRQNKWFFYFFYPIHLSVIFLARYLIFG